MEIAGKVALVTGAASGIGRACARAFAAAGARVVVADIDALGGGQTVQHIASAGGTARFIRGDVSTLEDITALFEQAEAAFGGLDIVHNNAAIMSSEPPWPDIAPERIAQVIATNAGGVLIGTRLAIDALRRRNGGAIVNTASVAGLAPMPFDPIYSATKAAVINFTQSCAFLREALNIRVNAVLPGVVNTPIINKTGDGTRPAAWLTPLLETIAPLEPEEIAAVVLDLVRDDSLAGETRVVPHRERAR